VVLVLVVIANTKGTVVCFCASSFKMTDMQQPLIYDPNRHAQNSSPRVNHSDSIHSVDSCLVDILAQREEKVFVPPTLRKVWFFLICAFTWTWTFGFIAVGWQHTEKQKVLDVLINVSGVGALLFAFVIQYFSDNGWEGCMKLIKRCHPKHIRRAWWVVCFLMMPASYAILNGLYTWFGGAPPETKTLKTFISDVAIGLLAGFLSEFGWRGMMLPEAMEVLDYWYWRKFGQTEGNDGLPIPYWVNKSTDADVSPIAQQRGSKTKQSQHSRSLRPVEEDDVNDEDEAEKVPHWKLSPLIASSCIGFGWALWHLPLFFVDGRKQANANILQYTLQAMAMAVFYTWQSNNTRNSILAAIIMHASIDSFSGMDPWGGEKNPGFWSQPNSIYTLELYIFVFALIWAVGPELGRRKTAVISR